MIDSEQLSRETLRKIVRTIAHLIDTEKQTLTNRHLVDCCAEIGRLHVGIVDPHLYHELAETALNLLVAEKYGTRLLRAEEPERANSEVLWPLQTRLPTQSWRSEAQINLQQFSTPVPIAYLMAYLVNLRTEDIVLEPSCGTGSLAVWARAAGAKVITNEIDQRRRELLRLLGFDPTAHNAEYIDDFLPVGLKPNVLLINPPFSSNGGRTGSTSNIFGFRHLKSALQRLEVGGGFGAILGERGSPRTITGNRFWSTLETQVVLSHVIEMNGREYYRNGTSTNVTLILGKKRTTEPREEKSNASATTTISVRSVEEAFAAIRPSALPS